MIIYMILIVTEVSRIVPIMFYIYAMMNYTYNIMRVNKRDNHRCSLPDLLTLSEKFLIPPLTIEVIYGIM